MTVNVFLVRWSGGFREVAHSSAGSSTRREAFLSLNAQSEAEVDRVAGALLDRLWEPTEMVRARVEPTDASDQPYTGYITGDYLTASNSSGDATSQRVRVISVEEDEDGEVSFAPELRDRVLENEDRVLRAIKRMANGSVQGRTDVASPSGRIDSGQQAAQPAAATVGSTFIVQAAAAQNIPTATFTLLQFAGGAKTMDATWASWSPASPKWVTILEDGIFDLAAVASVSPDGGAALAAGHYLEVCEVIDDSPLDIVTLTGIGPYKAQPPAAGNHVHLAASGRFELAASTRIGFVWFHGEGRTLPTGDTPWPTLSIALQSRTVVSF